MLRPGSSYSALARLELWSAAAVLAHDHPWRGIPSFGDAIQGWYVTPILKDAYWPTPISDPMTLAVRCGLPAVGVAVALWSWGMLQAAVLALRESARWAPWWASVAGVLITGAVTACWSTLLLTWSASFLWWMALAVGVGTGLWRWRMQTSRLRRHLLGWSLTAGVVVVGVMWCIGAWQASKQTVRAIYADGLVCAEPRHQAHLRGTVLIGRDPTDTEAESCQYLLRTWAEAGWRAVLVPLDASVMQQALMKATPPVVIQVRSASTR